MNTFSNKQLIVFDLDGTLAKSKQPVDIKMAALLQRLLLQKKVAVISGGTFGQFEKQFLPTLENEKALLSNLYLLPTSGSALYMFKETTEKNMPRGSWVKEYSHDLSSDEKEKIRTAFDAALENAGEKTPPRIYGERLEDRDSQMTFSALGQTAPIKEKAEWDPTGKRKLHIAYFLKPLLPDFSIGIGGMTSIDVTKKGIDKAFGVRELSKYANVPIEKMLYVGDALFPGGNDYAARASGVECHEVANVNETKRLIQKIISE
jgi:phosphomannomutase